MSAKIDNDLKQMDIGSLRREVMKLRRAIRLELRHTGNRRCWINLANVLPEGGEICPLNLPEEEFLKNCARYYRRNQKLPTKTALTRVAEEIGKNQKELEEYKNKRRLRGLTFTL
jgi:hypothetical protein